MHASYRVILELQEGDDPIQGMVGLERTTGVRFDGYVQLIGHLEGIRKRRSDPHGSEGAGGAGSHRPLADDGTDQGRQ